MLFGSFCLDLKAYILKVTRICMSNINFLIADVIQFASGITTTLSQGDGIKIKSKRFSEFGSRIILSLAQLGD